MSRQQNKTSLNLDLLLNWLAVEVSSGRAHHSIVRALSRAKRAEALWIAPDFFELTIGAHADATTMCVTRLFDRTRGTVSLYSLLTVARNHIGEFRNASAQDVRTTLGESATQLQGLEMKLTALRTRRHKTVAHKDPDPLVDPEGYIRDGKVSYQEIDVLFEQADDIIGKLCQLYFGKRPAINDPAAKQCDALLTLLASVPKYR
jgi:hypothetical protein